MAKKWGGKRPGAGRKPKAPKPKKPSASVMAKLAQMTLEQMQDFAKEAASQAIATLVEVARGGDKDTARVSAANSILDRAYGRPQAVAPSKPKHPDAPMPGDGAADGDDWAGLLN